MSAFALYVHRPARAGNIQIERMPTGAGIDQAPDRCLETAYVRHPAASRDINARRQLYWPLLVEAACAHGVPVELMDAVVLAESRYQVLALSRAGAAGLAQLMPGTARELGLTNRLDPRANLQGGARYLRQMLDTFGSPVLAVAAYNAGPGRVRRAGGVPALAETLDYVERVMDYWRTAMLPRAQTIMAGLPSGQAAATARGDVIASPSSLRLSIGARNSP